MNRLAALGVYIQSLDTGILPNPAFHEINPLAAISKVYTENPSAVIQILIAIAAVEVLGASIETQKAGGRPGDFGWDPANIRPKTEEALDEMQTKELNNGRLAMISIAGIALQASITGGGFPFY